MPTLALMLLFGAQAAEQAPPASAKAIAAQTAAASTEGTGGAGASAASNEQPSTDEKPRILVLELATSEAEEKKTAETLTGLLTAEVARHNQYAALSGADIKELMALEGQKAVLGCDEATSCLAEIAGAMGARFVVSGRLSRLDKTLVLQVNLFDAEAAEAIARSVHKASSTDQLADALASIADELVATADAALAGALTETSVSMSGSGSNERAAEPVPEGGTAPLLLYGGLGVAGAGVVLTAAAFGSSAVAYAAFSNLLGLDKDARQIARVLTFAGLASGLVGLLIVAAGAGVTGASFLVE